MVAKNKVGKFVAAVALAWGLSLSPAYAQQPVGGSVASGGTNAGKPVKMGCVYNSTAPTVTDGKVVDCQADSHGSLKFVFTNADGTIATPSVDATHNATALNYGPQVMLYASSTAPSAVTTGYAARIWGDLQGRLNILPNASSLSDTGALTCAPLITASTNANNCKASSGNVFDISAVNTTATIYYLRLYNLATAPTCSSSTGFIETIPIPANTAGAGIVRTFPVGRSYTTGIGFCVTGGGSSTDNTNAATGVYVSMGYR